MKAGRLIAATVMTAGILAVGFLAPEAVTEVMDRRLKTETAEFETESIQVESMEEMPDILQLVSRGYYGFELGYGVVREKSDMKDLEQKALESLSDVELVEMRSFSYHDEYPILAISESAGYDEAYGLEPENRSVSGEWEDGQTDVWTENFSDSLDQAAKGSTAAILWECQLSNAQEDILNMIIDDRSGKVVGFSWQKGMTEEMEEQRIERFFFDEEVLYQTGRDFLDEMMRKAGSFCEEYYELKLTDTEYETAVEDSYNTRLIGRMYFEDSQGKGITITLQTMLDGTWYSVNQAY
ncbi:MAG TPA: hypothetical protein H9705_08410 [Candidatus Fusicatenibacter intestinigallinarum]|uniref:Uncharacterized protein n=1 Tax=Candidatus Fusicatenibacter intestinigallinarum TaxID=2838598 RepID=A0A9D2NCM6_9FIRM|nr:hypothetical protein [Candidatus Fusicatenibacter intestinigallinarum]